MVEPSSKKQARFDLTPSSESLGVGNATPSHAAGPKKRLNLTSIAAEVVYKIFQKS